MKYAFTELRLTKVHAHHMTRNPASGRIMQKLGMTCLGSSQMTIPKNGKIEAIEKYEILSSNWTPAV